MTVAQFLLTGFPESGQGSFRKAIAPEGQLVVNEQLTIQLEIATTDNWERVMKFLDTALGVVIIVDGTQPARFAEIPALVTRLRSHKKMLPLIAVGAPEFPSPELLQSIRDLLPESTEIKVFPFIHGDSQTSQNALLALIYQILS